MRRTSKVLKWVGFGLLVVLSLSAVVAMTFPEPGAVDPLNAWEIAGRAVLFLAPLSILTLLAARWPALAARVLPAAVGVLVVMGIWYLIDPSGWQAWEERNAAARGIVAMVLFAPIAVFGLRHALAAGRLLLIVGVVAPLDVALTGNDWSSFVGGPYLTLTIVALMAGVLFILSDVAGRSTRRPAGARPAAGRRLHVRAP